MNKIKAIIFDMDGVLIDAKEWHYEAFNLALKLFGYKISREEHLIKFDGLPTKKKLEILSIEKGLPVTLHPTINHMKQVYTTKLISEKCKPILCHHEALSKLKQEGYNLALASNSIRKTVDLMMEKSELIQYLDFTLSSEDVTMAKPNPEIYIKAISKYGYNPKECLVVEDNRNGIKAALASGANILEVRTIYDVTYQNIKNKILEIEHSNEKSLIKC